MNGEKKQEAIFGAFDGTVSVIGFVFGLLIHHASRGSIAIGGLGGAVAAGVSMGSGEIEKSDSGWRTRTPVAFAMFVASLAGGLIPIWPFFVFSTGVAIIVAAIGCVVVATWIGYQKHRGWRGYLASFGILFCAAAVTLAVVSVIPQSV